MKIIFTAICILFFCCSSAQEKVVEKYGNGNIKYEAYVKDSVFDGLYKAYYPDGVLQKEGVYNNCHFTNGGVKHYTTGCGVGREKGAFREGKKDGIWKEYFPDGKLLRLETYKCGIMQGNFYLYDSGGKLTSMDFYNAGSIVLSQQYYENGNLEEAIHEEEVWKKDNWYKVTRTTSYYENGNLERENTAEENEDGFIHEVNKEYFRNGNKKAEELLVNHDRHGICSEYYESGNLKTGGFFEYDKPVVVQYFYNEDGTPQRLETWKNGKIVKTEFANLEKRSTKYTVKKYKRSRS